MPGLTIATDAPAASAAAATTARRGSASSRTSSPHRPPVSPITPPLGPIHLPGSVGKHSDVETIPNFARGRPVFTHTTQSNQVGVAPPPTPPVDFDANPDVLALKSAISILQLQRARAVADIQSLSRAKEAAIAHTEEFVADLAAGRVQVEGDPLFSGTGAGSLAGEDSSSDSDSDSGDQSDGPAEAPGVGTAVDGDSVMTDGAGAPSDTQYHVSNAKRKRRRKPGVADSTESAPWRKLPKPQSVVRCPPINWAQYGVVGEPLDKLHAEQIAAPTPGAPVVLGPGGAYEPKPGDQASAVGLGRDQPRRLVGIAAPYNPLRDKIDKKGKASRR